MVVSGVDGMETGRVEERLHEGNRFGTGVGVALLSERDVCVEAGINGTGYIGGGLGLEIGEREGWYVDKCKGGKSTVLALVQG